jgi:NAD(P)-dependent dehydrogenase (short-subunit alcohol dehydrogenase family)
MRRFVDRVSLVTGGGSALGRACCLLLAREGARAAVLDIDRESAGTTAREIRSADGEAAAHYCDVGDPASAREAVSWAATELGTPSVLCNVAGIQQYARAETLSHESWNRILQVNLTGTFLMCQAVLPHLLETRGAIVNVSSLAGLMGLPYDSAYCASKGGVVMLTKALAKEFADRGVRVNAVAPGAIETPMLAIPFPEDVSPEVMQLIPRTPLGACRPEEVAEVIAFLASEGAHHLTGAVIPVDGASTA